MAAISEQNEDDEEGSSDEQDAAAAQKQEESKVSQVVDKNTENKRKIVSSLHNNMQ